MSCYEIANAIQLPVGEMMSGAKVGEIFCANDFSAGRKLLVVIEFGINVQLASD